MRQNRGRGALQNIEGNGIRCKFMSVDETAASFVEGVAREAVVDVELPGGLDRLGKGAHETLNFFLRGLRSGHGIGASQAGKVLAERMSGNEGMKIILLVKIVGIVVPASEIGAGSRHSLTLAERLEQPIFIEIEEHLVVLIKLSAEGTIEQLDFRVAENREWRSDCGGRRSACP